MNKVKMFFFAAALTLVTVGVFAGKSKFSFSGLYLINGATVKPVTTSIPSNLTTTATSSQSPAILDDAAGIPYTLETYVTGSGYEPVYTSF